MAHFTKEEKSKLVERIKELLKDGFSRHEIVDALNAEQFKTTKGKDWEIKTLHNFFTCNSELKEKKKTKKKSNKKKRKYTKKAKPEVIELEIEEAEEEVELEEETGLPLIVFNAIYAPGFSNTQRIGLIRAYYQ